MTAKRMMNLAPVQLRRAVDKMDAVERYELVGQLDCIIQTAAIAAGYLRARQSDYRDAGHAAGVKSANRLLVKVRRVLNYSYPEMGKISF